MPEPGEDARSLFGLRKRAPRRPLSVTIILAVVLAFLFLSGPRDLDQDTAVAQARAYATAAIAARCGPVSAMSEGHISRVTSETGKLERFEIELTAGLSGSSEVAVQVHVWPGIRIGPRIPRAEGGHTALFVFEDGVEMADNQVRC